MREDGVGIVVESASEAAEVVFLEAVEGAPTQPRPRRRVWVRGVWAIVGLTATGLIAVGVVESVRSARTQRCKAQLEQIGLAFHQYQDRYNSFPAPALLDARGRPLLSWRVALLPFLGHQKLHDRFHHDEAWDSPHNLALVAEMPAVFGCPSGPPSRQGRTSYLVVVGPKTELGSVNTPFERGRGVDRREVTDGTSNTLLVIESDRTTIWTQPDDLTWERDGPLPRLRSPHRAATTTSGSSVRAGTHMLLVDGSVRFVRQGITPNILRALLTINGGEVIGGG